MIIAVNTRLLLPGKIEGIGRFALETLRIITRDHPEHQFIFIFDRKYSDDFVFSKNITPVTCFPPARHPALWYWFFEHSIPRILAKFNADFFFSPDGWLSLRTQVPSLPVIHDLNFLHFPHFIPFHVREYYAYFFPRFVQKAARIATVSEFTKRDIEHRFKYPSDKIDVVYNGASGFSPVHEKEKQSIRDKYSMGDPYFISVGLIHPRKNLTSLFLAFDQFKRQTCNNVKLIVVGARKWWTSEMQQALDENTAKEDIIFTGRVSDEELKKLTSSALGMIYISHFEGFGIPVLEAMYSDIPVICSSITSLPEVGGDAVLYADPTNVDSIATAMIKLYRNPEICKELILKGQIQREKFTWEKTAGMLWESIDQCLRQEI
jgi:glycosyltransferase involved in cell wall biosynthesis